jgi:hypothetical protein
MNRGGVNKKQSMEVCGGFSAIFLSLMTMKELPMEFSAKSSLSF